MLVQLNFINRSRQSSLHLQTPPFKEPCHMLKTAVSMDQWNVRISDTVASLCCEGRGVRMYSLQKLLAGSIDPGRNIYIC